MSKPVDYAELTEKRCTRCHEVKPVSEFYKYKLADWLDRCARICWQQQRPDGQLLWADFRLRTWDANKQVVTYKVPKLYRSKARAERVAMRAHAAEFKQVES